MKFNTDLMVKIFLVLIVIALVSYLIYAIVVGTKQCRADKFKNDLRERLTERQNNRPRMNRNTPPRRMNRREGFANPSSKPQVKLFYANWCPHCSKFVNKGQKTELYNNLVKSTEHLVEFLEPQDCATFKDYPKNVRGFPSFMGKRGENWVDLTPSKEGIQAFVNGN